jgi:outer membrane protein OmpA-like peptidoglycan-associated protein
MSGGDSRVWISVSDMMTGLMMVFLFISILFMQQVEDKKKQVESIALTQQTYQEDLYRSLVLEFKDDLEKWNAELLADTTVRFNEPEVLFDEGSKEIKPRFEEILVTFFPRYIALLANQKYLNNIDEVRIEGHTSSSWLGSKDIESRYLNNALLSQQRSFTILDYCFRLPQVVAYKPWLTKVLRANGLAFANPVLVNGKEDSTLSRRVEFKVKTKTDEKIRQMIDAIKQPNSAI